MVIFSHLTWQRLIISLGHNHRNIHMYIPLTHDQRYDCILPPLRSYIAKMAKITPTLKVT